MAKICGNRWILHVHVNVTWYVFGGNGIAKPLFSTFKLIAKPESTCMPNWKETSVFFTTCSIRATVIF